ncbi:MAG: septum site-determining protein MinC [Cyanobium sp.]
MAATLIPAQAPGLPHLLRLPDHDGASSLLDEVRYGLGQTAVRGELDLETGDWLLRAADLRRIETLLARLDLRLLRVRARRPETLVAAAGLGLETLEASPRAQPTASSPTAAVPMDGLQIHRGTLRAGEHLQSEGSVLLLGDLNPGARLSAAGHVLVWGRLRGIAHAGCQGNREARIVALQLRPLQLRIADAVARGPEETPAPGQAEQVRLVNGEIRIDPAPPQWPLAASAPQERGWP